MPQSLRIQKLIKCVSMILKKVVLIKMKEDDFVEIFHFLKIIFLNLWKCFEKNIKNFCVLIHSRVSC